MPHSIPNLYPYLHYPTYSHCLLQPLLPLLLFILLPLALLLTDPPLQDSPLTLPLQPFPPLLLLHLQALPPLDLLALQDPLLLVPLPLLALALPLLDPLLQALPLLLAHSVPIVVHPTAPIVVVLIVVIAYPDGLMVVHSSHDLHVPNVDHPIPNLPPYYCHILIHHPQPLIPLVPLPIVAMNDDSMVVVQTLIWL